MKIPNKAISSVFWDNVNLPLPFPSRVELGSWSAFSDGLNLSLSFFFFLVVAHFYKRELYRRIIALHYVGLLFALSFCIRKSFWILKNSKFIDLKAM